ncbi:NADH-quinone oxidoreductase subunit NuoF [Planctomycetota bacterium]
MIEQKCCDQCRHNPDHPCNRFVECLSEGPFCHEDDKCVEERKKTILRLRREELNRPVIFIGTGTCGLGAGAGKTIEAVKNYLEHRKVEADIVEVGCIGFCSSEPILEVQLSHRPRVAFQKITEEKVDVLLEAVLSEKIPSVGALGQHRNIKIDPWPDIPYLDEHPFFAAQTRWVLANCGIINPNSIEDYLAHGGYRAYTKTLREISSSEVCAQVEKSGLRGRGGGGFPTGKKWRFALETKSDQKFLICNADEGDPGAFMDRAVIEGDPHRLLEGMAIAAYAIGVAKAYVYIRAEYPLAIKRLKEAIAQAQAYGLLGHNILDSGFKLEIIIKQGAGAFVCGEETALIHSIEGKRGMPRPRPPFPAVQGLFGKPTVINNVETLANIPSIINKGADWFNAVGTENSKGTKVFALSGKVNRTGLVEVAMGTTLRQIVFEAGGGIAHNKQYKAVQIGGPSGGCIPTEHLDIEIDYESLKKVGAMMGSGGLVVMDENTCMVDLAKFFMDFIQRESCGKCIPCREGTKQMLEILQAITRGHFRETELDALMRFRGIMQLEKLAEAIKATSLCGLGQTAPNPILSTLRYFRDEYEAHVFERRCPAGTCKDLVGVSCQNSCPVGTEVWRYVAHIARGEYPDAYRVIRQANPFPSACARVCHHPCEQNCQAGVTGGEPIAVRTLKRFVVDRVDPNIFTPEVMKNNSKSARIAVIGAGPSGLTAAHYLSLKGHKVTIFERESQAGGMLMGGIPEYRLPKEILRKEIGSLLNENIDLKFNMTLGREITIDDLLNDGYHAVYVAVGAHQSKKLNLTNEDVEGIIAGIKSLKVFNLNGKSSAQGRVGVIGGGNSAIDAARVAIRQKDVDSVTIFYRRTKHEMPAYTEEIEAGLVEGVKIEELVTPVAVKADNGRLTGVRFIRNKLGEPDISGRQRPIPIPDSEFDVALDTLIVAIGEEPKRDALAGLGLTKQGTLVINTESNITDRPGVFGGGDVVSGPGTVIEAIGAGKNAAVMIDRYVTGKLLKVLPKVKLPSVYIEPIQTSEEIDEIASRITPPELPTGERKRNYAEVEMSISEQAAFCEARRCLRCDLDFTQTE